MDSMRGAASVNAIVFQEGDWWCVQCLEYDIAAQAKSLEDIHYELVKMLAGHISVSLSLGREPFAGLGTAPEEYWRMYREAGLSIETETPPFRAGPVPPFPVPVPHMKIGKPRSLQPTFA